MLCGGTTGKHRKAAAARRQGASTRAGQAGQAWSYPSTPCVGSARGTDSVREEEGGHPLWRHDGKASLGSGCKEAGRIDSCRTGRAGLRVPTRACAAREAPTA